MNDSYPLVSVIIPVFRVEKFLEKGVNSIINQSYKNLQIILVDDGSDDGCPQMCDEFEKIDERVMALHKKNGGLSDARNYGIDRATGEYIYFFDSDDYLEPNAIESLVSVAENKKADVVAFGYKKVDEAGNNIENSFMKSGEYHFETDEEKLEFISRVLCAYRVGWEAWSRLYRGDIVRKNNLRFEPNKEIFAEDRCFNIYYTLCSDNLYFLEERFYHYLIRDDSIMGKAQEPKLNEILRLMDYIQSFAMNHGIKTYSKYAPYINVSLFDRLIFKIDDSDFKKYRSIWKCEDIEIRFGGKLKRPFIFLDLFGKKNGFAKYKRFEKFLYCNR